MKECAECKAAGLERYEYLHPEEELGATNTAGEWICDDCADATHEERAAEQRAKE